MMETIQLWLDPRDGEYERHPVRDATEYAALTRADFDALAADAAETRTLRAERDSLRQERDGLLHTSDKQTVAWKHRALMAEQERDEARQKVSTLLSVLRGEQGIEIDGVILHPCAERDAATARADALAALLKEARGYVTYGIGEGDPHGIGAAMLARIDAALEVKK